MDTLQFSFHYVLFTDDPGTRSKVVKGGKLMKVLFGSSIALLPEKLNVASRFPGSLAYAEFSFITNSIWIFLWSLVSLVRVQSSRGIRSREARSKLFLFCAFLYCVFPPFARSFRVVRHVVAHFIGRNISIPPSSRATFWPPPCNRKESRNRSGYHIFLPSFPNRAFCY